MIRMQIRALMGEPQNLKARGLAKRGGVGKQQQPTRTATPCPSSTTCQTWVKAYETGLEYDVRPKASKSHLSQDHDGKSILYMQCWAMFLPKSTQP